MNDVRDCESGINDCFNDGMDFLFQMHLNKVQWIHPC